MQNIKTQHYNPVFKGYLKFAKDNHNKIEIQEQRYDRKGKLAYFKPLHNLTINTDHIVSVNSTSKAPIGGRACECIYIDMANGTRYAIEKMSKKDFDNKLFEAINSPKSIVDMLV